MREYRYHSQPGCGGCLLMAALLLLITGGLPLLINVLGTLIVVGLGLMLCIILFFRLLSWLIRRKVSEYERYQSEADYRFVLVAPPDSTRTVVARRCCCCGRRL
jgi:DnaJ like chaperone protein